MTNGDVLLLAKQYGLSNEVTGYTDFEAQLLRFVGELFKQKNLETTYKIFEGTC